MKVYELILLLYSLFVVVWCICGIRKEDKWFHWFFEYGTRKCMMIRAISCMFTIFVLAYLIISKIDWSFLTVEVW